MKRVLCIILSLLLLSAMTSGCGTDPKLLPKGQLTVSCTSYPVYDWIREVIGENSGNLRITYVSAEGDIHSFQPSLQNIANLAMSNLLIYVGGESDKWAVETAKRENLNALKLFDVNSEELIVTEHNHDEGQEHHQANEVYDEHIWMSLTVAENSVRAICDAICEIDPKNSSQYRENTENYCKKLRELDENYKKVVSESGDKTVIFADRFPYIYMTEEYGINYYSAFSGCSTDAEASFEVISRLVEKVDELGIKTLIVPENSDCTVAETVIANSAAKNGEIAVLNSLQSTTDESYLEVMTKNLEVLKKALN